VDSTYLTAYRKAQGVVLAADVSKQVAANPEELRKLANEIAQTFWSGVKK
jgi:hypothetical protein